MKHGKQTAQQCGKCKTKIPLQKYRDIFCWILSRICLKNRKIADTVGLYIFKSQGNGPLLILKSKKNEYKTQLSQQVEN